VENYDLFLNYSRSWNGLSNAGRASLSSFFAAGGDYVGLRGTGIGLAKSAGIIDVDYVSGSSSNNAIVNVTYNSDDSVAGGFLDEDYAFVYGPAWFTRLGVDVVSSAEFGGGDFLVSGYWVGWQGSGAAGNPVVVHGSSGDSDTILIGIDTTFRAHPENTFRLLGNAIFTGLE
jgi:hypothetical protein